MTYAAPLSRAPARPPARRVLERPLPCPRPPARRVLERPPAVSSNARLPCPRTPVHRALEHPSAVPSQVPHRCLSLLCSPRRSRRNSGSRRARTSSSAPTRSACRCRCPSRDNTRSVRLSKGERRMGVGWVGWLIARACAQTWPIDRVAGPRDAQARQGRAALGSDRCGRTLISYLMCTKTAVQTAWLLNDHCRAREVFLHFSTRGCPCRQCTHPQSGGRPHSAAQTRSGP